MNTTKSVSLKVYIRQKIRMLTEDFDIHMGDSEIDHMKSLKSEIEVDNYARKLLADKL